MWQQSQIPFTFAESKSFNGLIVEHQTYAFWRLSFDVQKLRVISIRVGRDFSKWWYQVAALGLRIPLGMVFPIQNFRTLGCVTAVCRALKVFVKWYITLQIKVFRLAPHTLNQPTRLQKYQIIHIRSKLGKLICNWAEIYAFDFEGWNYKLAY